jgi:hypothetical protein
LKGDFHHEEHEVRKNPTGRFFFVSFVLFVVKIGFSLATPCSSVPICGSSFFSNPTAVIGTIPAGL